MFVFTKRFFVVDLTVIFRGIWINLPVSSWVSLSGGGIGMMGSGAPASW